MITFQTELLKFGAKGEKSGWTYIEITASMAEQLNPGTRTSFRVKGSIDQYTLSQVALVPMGEGDFILAVNTTMRKALRKEAGAKVTVTLALDASAVQLSADLLACLEDAPEAKAYFDKLPGSHQKYYTRWIESAKTPGTKAKRITQAIMGMTQKMDFGETLRHFKGEDAS